MSLGRLIVEEGVEMTLKADMNEVIALLDSEVPRFVHDGYGYRISSSKGVLGSQWNLVVKPWDPATASEMATTVGVIEIEKLKTGGTGLKIPPRGPSDDDVTRDFDEDDGTFASFVFQLLNIFQRRGFIDLPGQLPVD